MYISAHITRKSFLTSFRTLCNQLYSQNCVDYQNPIIETLRLAEITCLMLGRLTRIWGCHSNTFIPMPLPTTSVGLGMDPVVDDRPNHRQQCQCSCCSKNSLAEGSTRYTFSTKDTSVLRVICISCWTRYQTCFCTQEGHPETQFKSTWVTNEGIKAPVTKTMLVYSIDYRNLTNQLQTIHWTCSHIPRKGSARGAMLIRFLQWFNDHL